MAPRMAAVTYAFASLIASISARPWASPAAMAAEYVHPVPWVAGPSTRGAGKRVSVLPSQSTSVAASLRWPPFTRTWRGPSAPMRRAASTMSASESTAMSASTAASWRFGVTTVASGSSSRTSTPRAAGCRSGAGVRPGDAQGLRNGHRLMQYTPPRRRIIRRTLTSPPRAATVAPMSEPLMRTRRWTRQEYGRLIDLGFFGEDRKGNKVELLEGRMIVAEPQNTPHATACDLAGGALRAALGACWRARRALRR